MRNKVICRIPGGIGSMISSAFHNCFKPEDKSKKNDPEDRKLTAEEISSQAEEERLEREREEELIRKAEEEKEEATHDTVVVHYPNITDDGEGGYTRVSFSGGDKSPLLEEYS